MPFDLPLFSGEMPGCWGGKDVLVYDDGPGRLAGYRGCVYRNCSGVLVSPAAVHPCSLWPGRHRSYWDSPSQYVPALRTPRRNSAPPKLPLQSRGEQSHISLCTVNCDSSVRRQEGKLHTKKVLLYEVQRLDPLPTNFHFFFVNLFFSASPVWRPSIFPRKSLRPSRGGGRSRRSRHRCATHPYNCGSFNEHAADDGRVGQTIRGPRELHFLRWSPFRDRSSVCALGRPNFRLTIP